MCHSRDYWHICHRFIRAFMQQVRFICCLLFTLFISQLTAQGQSLTINYTLKKPVANPAMWDDDPVSITLSVINHTEQTIELIPDIRIQAGGKIFVRTNPAMFIPLTITPGSHTFSSDVIFPDVTLRYISLPNDQDLESGIYEVCASVIPKNANIAKPPDDCEVFMIDELLRPTMDIVYKSPTITSPAPDKLFTHASLSQAVFRWTTVAPRPPFDVQYHFYLFKTEKGKPVVEIMRSAEPLIHEVITETSAYIPTGAGSLDTGSYFCVIQSTRSSGATLGQNNGLSLPLEFRLCTFADCAPVPVLAVLPEEKPVKPEDPHDVKPEEKPDIPDEKPAPVIPPKPKIIIRPIDLYYPANDQVVMPDSLRFEWQGLPLKNTRYEVYYAYTKPLPPDPEKQQATHPFTFTFSDKYLALADTILDMRKHSARVQVEQEKLDQLMAAWQITRSELDAKKSNLNITAAQLEVVKEGLRTSKEIRKIKLPKACKTLTPCIPEAGMTAGLDSSNAEHRQAVFNQIQCIEDQISEFENLLIIHNSGLVSAYHQWVNQSMHGHHVDSLFAHTLGNLYADLNVELPRALLNYGFDINTYHSDALGWLQSNGLCGVAPEHCTSMLNNCNRGNAQICAHALNRFILHHISEGTLIPEFALKMQAQLSKTFSLAAGLPTESFESIGDELIYHTQMAYQSTLCLQNAYQTYDKALQEAGSFYAKASDGMQAIRKLWGDKISSLRQKQGAEKERSKAALKQELAAAIETALQKADRRQLANACCKNSLQGDIHIAIPGDDHLCARQMADLLRHELGQKFCYLAFRINMPCDTLKPITYESTISARELASCWTRGIQNQVVALTLTGNNFDGSASIPPKAKPVKKGRYKPKTVLPGYSTLVSFDTLQPGYWWVQAYNDAGDLVGISPQRSIRPFVKPNGKEDDIIEPLKEDDTALCICQVTPLWNGQVVNNDEIVLGIKAGDQATLSMVGIVQGSCLQGSNYISIAQVGNPLVDFSNGKSVRFTFRDPGRYRIDVHQVSEDEVCRVGYWVDVSSGTGIETDLVNGVFPSSSVDTAWDAPACMDIAISEAGKDRFETIRYRFADLSGFANLDVQLRNSCFKDCDNEPLVNWTLEDPEGKLTDFEGTDFTQLFYKPGTYKLSAIVTLKDCEAKNRTIRKKVWLKTK